MEVCPVFVILIILKVSSVENHEIDSLPSVFLGSEEQACKNRDSSRKILSRRLLISYSESGGYVLGSSNEKKCKSCPSKPVWQSH